MENNPLVPRQPVILLVEDDDSIRKLMAVVLEDAGFNLITASNSLEALKLLETSQEDIHLMVTDIQMPPGMNGLSLADEVRHRFPDIPVLFISGYNQFHNRLSEIVDGHRTQFLQKPFSPYQLVDAVRQVILI